MPPTGIINESSQYVLGVDLARMGEDKSVFVIIEKPAREDILYVVFIEETSKKKLTDPVGRIWFLHQKFRFRKIYVDMTGLGSGPVDFLQVPSRVGAGVVEGITFKSRGAGNKIDMYSNLQVLLTTGRLKIPNHPKLKFELLDLRYEIDDDGKLKIHHPDSKNAHDDYPDALCLAAWHWRGSKKTNYNWHAA